MAAARSLAVALLAATAVVSGLAAVAQARQPAAAGSGGAPAVVATCLLEIVLVASAVCLLRGGSEGRLLRAAPLVRRSAVELVRDEAYWRQVKAMYLLNAAPFWLNCGGLGPTTLATLETVESTQRTLAAAVDTGHALFDACRQTVAAFFSAQPEQFCFTRNATEATSIVAAGLGFNWAPDAEVIFESHAHPGGSFPWLNLQNRGHCVVRIFEPSADSVEDNLARIRSLITPRTKLIQVSHVTCTTGLCFPVEAIAAMCQKEGIWFHVDGAQSAGMFPVDLPSLGCDSFATSCHKWMGAVNGTGLLWLRDVHALDACWPTEIGAYCDSGYVLPNYLAYSPTATRYEYGTRCAASVQSIASACTFLSTIGMENVGQRGAFLAQYVQAGIAAIPGVTILTPGPKSGLRATSITTFKVAGWTAADLYSFLLTNYQCRCRVVTEQGLDALRVSTHIFNLLDDCDLLIAGVRAASATWPARARQLRRAFPTGN